MAKLTTNSQNLYVQQHTAERPRQLKHPERSRRSKHRQKIKLEQSTQNTALYAAAAVAATALSHATAHRPSSTMSNAEDVKSEDSKADPNIVSIKVRGQVR